MKCLCLTGFGSAPQRLYPALTAAGMATPLPANCQPPMDIYTWHRQALELLEQKDEETQQGEGLGRMWERLASEIFLTNGSVPLWGWADEASSWLLDFWRDFDPRLNFVLLFARVETVVVAHIAQLEAQELTLDQLLEAWRQRHQALLHFGLRHPKCCLLLDADEALANPDMVTKQLRSRWKLPLSLPDALPSAVFAEPNPMARFLAGQLLKQHPEILALQQEIDSNLIKLNSDFAQTPAESINAEVLISGFRGLLDRSSEQHQIQLLKEQCSRLDQLHQRTLDSYQQQYKDALARGQESSSQLQHVGTELQAVKDLAEKREENIRVLEEKLHSSVEENELLLMQLHQAQEELELTFLRREELKKPNTEELNALQARLAQAEGQHKELQLNVVVALEQKLQESAEENELLLLHLHQVQEELEALFLRSENRHKAGIEQQKELQTQLAQALKQYSEQASEVANGQARVEQLTKERDQHGKQVVELTAELDKRARAEQEMARKLADTKKQVEQLAKTRDEQGKLDGANQQKLNRLEQDRARLEGELKSLKEIEMRQAQTLKELEQKLEEAADENELQMLQLHQMQEELECYFRHVQEAQAKHAELEARLRKMRERYPDYAESGAIEIRDVRPSRAAWCLRDSVLAGKDFKELRFVTVVEHGMAGFVFMRGENGAHQFFDRWPSDKSELTLLPLATHKQVKERSSALLALSTSEWWRLLALTDFLIGLLEKQPQAIDFPEGFKSHSWLEALRTLKVDLQQFPAVPRFDKLKLKRHQVNPDYEHLWLVFENLSIGERSVSNFEFRISCASVRPKIFGKFPKLEFPEEGGQTLLDSWFEESYDDFGAKLELRYALPESMDLGMWHKLSAKDQGVVRALIKNLPVWLHQLEEEGHKLNRSWQEWKDMVAEVQRITALHAAERKSEPTTPPIKPIAAQPAFVAAEAEDGTLDPVMALLDAFPMQRRKATVTTKAQAPKMAPVLSLVETHSAKKSLGKRNSGSASISTNAERKEI